MFVRGSFGLVLGNKLQGFTPRGGRSFDGGNLDVLVCALGQGGCKASIRCGCFIAAVMSVMGVTGVFWLILFPEKSVSFPPSPPSPCSFRATPDAESLIKATRGRFIFNMTILMESKFFFWHFFPVCIILGLMYLLQTYENAACITGYLVG